MTMAGLVTFAVGCAATIEDLAHRRVSNWTSAAALAAGITIQTAHQGWRGAVLAAAGAAAGFAVFLIFYLCQGLGGGDVKLMAGFGSVLGPGLILWAAWMAAVAGGLMAVGFAAVKAARAWRHAKSSAPALRDTALAATEAIPYAPAIVAGVWLAEFTLG